MNISISIPPDLQTYIEARIATGDYSNMTEYVLALVKQDYQRQEAAAKLGALLQEGLDSESQTVSADYWDTLKSC